MAAASTKNIDSAVAIRTARILKVLDETIGKIELALYLPVLLKNLDRFGNIFDDDELIVLSKYESQLGQIRKEKTRVYTANRHDDELSKEALPSDNVSNRPPLVDKEAQYFEMEYEKPQTNGAEDHGVKEAVYIVWKHTDMVHTAKNEYLKFATESSGLIFLEKMRAFRECAHNRLMEDISPEAEMRKIVHFRDVWHKNDEAKTKINTLKPLLDDLKAQVQIKLEEKNKLICELENNLKNLEIKFKEEIDKICADSEQIMVFERKSNEARQEIILSDVKNLNETYQNTLKDHLKQEKQLQMRRTKIESKLEECLEKYDSDMDERQREYEKLLTKYKDEEQLMASLQEKFDKQEKEYITLMEEKAYEEHLELERCIEDLRRRVAARIIQRHWRGLKQRRLERAKSKKARKGKGKKKGGEKPKSPQN